MKASNNLHQICLGTYPPINYLKPMSLEIMDALHEMNEGGILAAYTFDAGPNPVIFMPKKNEKTVSSRIGEVVGGMENLSITRMGPGARFDKKHLF
jgi:diphosphomevalonate decarboxylase